VNISLPGNAVDVSDHIEIQCSVRYNGTWTPDFICSPHLPGTTISNTSSNPVLYKRVIAASDIEDFSELNCYMTFTLVTGYQATSSDVPIEPEKPLYDFVWKTSAIRVVNASGMYTQVLGRSCNMTFWFLCDHLYTHQSLSVD